MTNWSHFIPQVYFPCHPDSLFYPLQFVRIRRNYVFLLEFFLYFCLPFEVAHGFGLAETFLIRTLITLVKTEWQGQPVGCLWPRQGMGIAFGTSSSNICLSSSHFWSHIQSDITGRAFYKLPYLLCQWAPPIATAFLAWTNGEEVNLKSDIDVNPK